MRGVWITEEERTELIRDLRFALQERQKVLEMLESRATCSVCHYGRGVTHCQHSAYQSPFERLALRPGLVRCKYFALPFCEICIDTFPQLEVVDGKLACPKCKNSGG